MRAALARTNARDFLIVSLKVKRRAQNIRIMRETINKGLLGGKTAIITPVVIHKIEGRIRG